jgi:dihydrofolate reductase
LNIIITRQNDWHAEGVETAPSLGDAVRLAQMRAAEMPEAREICVIGGGEIFSEALPMTDILHVTHVLAPVDGDTFFPPIEPAIWTETASADIPAGERDTYPTRHTVYERRSAA